ncbi:MAG: SPFH domain-containing protein [Bryobacterales bacterium]|nr:SPFH domain-containing protein [Bryobacteraceae bacterium]MDW8130178.1 SPFH domain-containing protein [Bryobacterales bacterium]
MQQERIIQGLPGWPMAFLLLAVPFAAVYGLVQAARAGSVTLVILWLLVLVLDLIGWFGLTVVNPNEAKVITLFGVYKGTIKQAGFRYVHPLASKRRVSLRVRNFESGKLKVNDRDGNPIEIAAVVVWRVVETFEAVFNVDDYENFVHVQTEAALRNLATSYPYDAHEEGELSLRLSAGEVAERLRHEIQERLARAGIEVIEARISHLAYAPEIAGAMLRRQQAAAVVAARQKIVEGAVSMVEMALEEIRRRHVIELDEERKAAMVSNLLVVLCSDRGVEPVVNTGTLYV